MTIQPITTKQFIGSSVLITIAFTFLMVTQGRFSVLFTLPLMTATFVIMPPDVRKRSLRRGQLVGALAAVAATAALIWWLISHRTPETDSWGRSLLNAFSHPLVAIPIWLGFLFLGYRRWRMKPPLKDGLTHGRE